VEEIQPKRNRMTTTLNVIIQVTNKNQKKLKKFMINNITVYRMTINLESIRTK